MSEKITIYDIAKKLNITAATVSRALNNNPRISDTTRKLVMETAASMGYTQNKLALALKSGKSNLVGVIVPYIDTSFFASIIRGIEEALHPEGYNVIICQTHETEAKEIETVNTLLNAQVDGILMSLSKTSKETTHFEHILNKKIPLVFFDRRKNIKGVSSVTIDDFEGGYVATKHLIEQGCKTIAHLSGDWSLEIYKNRSEGYKQALLDHGLKYDEKYLLHVKSDTEAGKSAVDTLMKLDKKPDAIFSSSDFVALGAIQRLQELGIKLPDDFCVVGFSNEPFTQLMELSISSVDQAPHEMGRMAAKVFLDQVSGVGKVKIEQKVELTPHLISRKSSVKPVAKKKAK
ncbi:LacI family DNA-binding transcriptional regulator [Fulvivirga sp. 29W222]|uniref:LacI family DNA-binding transcriptional regulator n=1 Tax=Fulvivirga marina TaxID=2494733 RepID=A0A937KGJ7_9BACT|nr:LacI family DNA-binding transcriptional regulator [Fulvivirga marina]MBL6449268.1 LacI family DNA-binding transcriptional regulator [Fulvivirga marina]